jgi:hypothetical protein
MMGGADCELIRDAWLAQPANAWSSAAFLVAAAWVGAGRTAGGAVGAVALALVAVGSAAYHGPQPGWAEPVHDASIVLLLGVVLVQRVEPSWKRPAAALSGTAAVVALLAPGLDVVAQAAVALALAVAEIRRWRAGRTSPSDRVALVALAVGALLFALGRTGGPLCDPETVVQPHAGWHVAAAVAAAAALGGRSTAGTDRSYH